VAGLLTKITDTDLRLRLMRGLVGEGTDDADALFALAMLEAGSRNYPQAEALTRRALALRPDWSEAKVFLVRVLASAAKNAEAREALEQFLRQTPDDNLLRASYARLLVEQEDLKAARDQFKRLLNDKPEDGEILFALGVLSVELKELGEARDYFQRLYGINERRDEAAFYLGQIAEQDGAKDKALDWYQKVEGKHLLEAQLRIARLRAKMGEVRLAREIIQQLRSRAGDNGVQLSLVEEDILREAKQYPAAMEVLDQALAKHPDNHDLLYARALLAVPMGRLDILERDLQRVIREDPKHADALNALGYTLADQTDRFTEAQGYIQRALDLKPDSPAILDSMGWLQYRLGNRPQAVEYLRKALKLLPDGEIAAHLGEVLWVSGDRDEARRVWNEILTREPDSEDVLRAMERFKD
jgi:tetratricopeptide (TPR) repeat protein